MRWIFACLLLSIAGVGAHHGRPHVVYSSEAQVGSACRQSVLGNNHRLYSATCFDQVILASVLGCVASIYDNSTQSLTDVANSLCSFSKVKINEANVTNALDLYYSSAVDFTKVGHGRITVPIRVNATYRDLCYKSYKYFYGNYNNSVYYGSALLGFWLGVWILYAAVNWGRCLFPLRRQRQIVKFIQRFVFTPATFKLKNYDPVRMGWFEVGLAPKRIETLIIASFVIITAVLTGIKYYWDSDNTIYPISSYSSESHARRIFISRLVGDRSGIIGTFLMPLLIVLGGRNNFLQWLTGSSFATMIVWHKWISRICIIEILIHTVCWTIALDARAAQEYRELYLVGGTFAFVAMVFILFQTLLFLRRRWYEVFFLFHFGLSVLTIAGSWIHLKPLGYGPFMYAAVAVWAFDRFVRLIRMSLIGLKTAEFTLVEDTIIVKVPISNPQFYPPGGHVYLTIPSGLSILQSHPFCYVVHSDHIKMFAKVKDGLTSSLAKKLVKSPSLSCSKKVLLDGPYAEPLNVNRYDGALFLASGNGIPGMWSEALEYAQKHRDREVKLVWITRTMEWFVDELLDIPANLELVVYQTGIQTIHQSASDSDKKSTDSKDLQSVSIKVPTIQGRPKLEEIINTEAANASTNLAVVVCGHPAMVDEVRAVVARNHWDSAAFVDLFVQLQVWA